MTGDEEDDVPPLEDMSEAFTATLKLREEKQATEASTTKREVLRVPQDADQQKVKRIEQMLGKEVDQREQAKPAGEKGKKKENSDSFCGFKKGFFDVPKTKQSSLDKTRKETKRMPSVTKKVDENKNVFPEVQEAINQQIPFLKSDAWVTDDLLAKIMAHPKLSKQFTDPRFFDAIAKFQTNPQQVMEMCQHDPEVREFIQSFSAIMGEHFTELGKKQERQEEMKKVNEKSPVVSADDKERMGKILSDPEIADILKTREVQMLLKYLREEPDKAQRMLRSADTALRFKIQKLVDAGLLQMAV